jgi:hypothetical protein
MSYYENDPRVTQVGDDEYQIDTGPHGPWRVYRDGDRWFSESPPNDSPHLPDHMTFEHPSKEEAFKAMLNPKGGAILVPPESPLADRGEGR